jgi:hypothetical protein
MRARQTIGSVADAVGKGLIAGFAGTAAMTLSSTLEAKLRGRAPSSAPARATAKMLGIKKFEDSVAQARSTTSPTGAMARGGRAARTARRDRNACQGGDGGARRGHLRGGPGDLPALEIAPPSVFWAREEIAIYAFHHAVYAAARGSHTS